MKSILLIGSGGHCKSVMDSIDSNIYSKIILCDITEHIGNQVLGIPVTATDEDWQMLYNDGCRHAFVTVGSVGDPTARINIWKRLKEIGYTLPAIVDKTAAVSLSADISEGVFVGKMSVINAQATIGKCAIINTAAVVEHDCVIEDFVHIAPGARLAGNVKVGYGAHIGIGAVVKEGVTIGKGAILGAGAVAVTDIPPNCTAVGVPARPIKFR